MADCEKCSNSGVIVRAKRSEQTGFVAEESVSSEVPDVDTYEVFCDCEHGVKERAVRERRAILQEIEAAPEWHKDYVRSLHENRLERLNRIIRGETDFSPEPGLAPEDADDGYYWSTWLNEPVEVDHDEYHIFATSNSYHTLEGRLIPIETPEEIDENA